jgi:N6-adenosine-specific RNA methylase IME4
LVTDIEQPSLFDYASLDGDTRVFVQEKAQAIHARLKRTAEDIIAIGQDLMAVKEKLPDMKFSAWLRSEFGMTRSMAYNFINVSKRFPNGCPNFGQVSVSVLYELAAPSTPDAVIEMVETKRIPPTLSAIREVKRELQQENLPPQQSLEEVVPSFAQWQQDNVDLGLDRWADPLPVVAPHERPFYEVQREIKREETRERLAQLKSKGVELPLGKYSCLIVDPPWQMQKIERDVRPNQVEFDYPTMTEDELKSFPLPQLSGDDCHLYLWTTQKHLPLALRLADHWGFKYQCLLTWRKNVGFTPFSWMYSTEHVLFCTKGSLPLLRMGVRLDFEAKVREHSRKPDEFYDIVREVSPGPRLDVFSREKRDGFDQYGNEVAKFE